MRFGGDARRAFCRLRRVDIDIDIGKRQGEELTYLSDGKIVGQQLE